MQRISTLLLCITCFTLFSTSILGQYTYEALPIPDGGGGIPSSMVKISDRLFKTAYNEIAYSDDDGLSWHNCPPPQGISTITSSVSTTGRLYLAGAQKIYFSDNLGVSWDTINAELPTPSYIELIHAVSDDTLVVCTRYNIYRSNDGGLTWADVYSIPEQLSDPKQFFALENSDVLFLRSVTSQGGFYHSTIIYRSSNNGRTWTKVLDALNTGALNRLSYSETGRLFLNGLFARYWHSDDTGIHWTEDTLHVSNDPTYLPPVYSITPGQGSNVLASCGGKLMASEDNGETWQAREGYWPEFFMISHPEAGIFASRSFWDWKSIFRSTDNGYTWDFASKGIDKGIFLYIDFISEQEILLSNDDGIYKTTNNGQTWDNIFKQDMRGGGLLLEKDSAHNLFITNSSPLISSSDGGNSWTAQTILNHIQPVRVNPAGNAIYSISSNAISYNKGETWQNLTFDPPLSNIFFTPEGKTEGVFYSQTNLKYYAQEILNDTSIGEFRGYYPFYPEVYAIGYNGFRIFIHINEAYYSEDYGQNWVLSPNPFDVSSVSFSFGQINMHNHIFCYSWPENAYLASYDKGVTWDTLNITADFGFGKVRLSPEGRLYFLGKRGMMYRTTQPVSVDYLNDLHKNLILVAPNPAAEFADFYFSLATPANSQLNIYDFSGKLINTTTIRNPQEAYTLNTSQLPNGTYIYQLLFPDGKSSQPGKIAIQHTH